MRETYCPGCGERARYRWPQNRPTFCGMSCAADLGWRTAEMELSELAACTSGCGDAQIDCYCDGLGRGWRDEQDKLTAEGLDYDEYQIKVEERRQAYEN